MEKNSTEQPAEEKQEVQPNEQQKEEVKEQPTSTTAPKLEEQKAEEKLDDIVQKQPLQEIDDNLEIKAQVTDPIKKEKTMSNYIIYTVKGTDKNGEFLSQKRYSDFDKLRVILQQRWPGCFIPPIPPKQAIGNLEDKFIDERKVLLDNFIKQLATSKFIWYSDEMQIFVRQPDTDLEKQFANLPKQTNEDLRVKYEKYFGDIIKNNLTPEIKDKMQKYKEYVQKITKMLNNYKVIVENVMKTRKTHNESFFRVLQFLFPEYEKVMLQEYVNNETDGRFVFNEEQISKLVDDLKQIADQHKLSDFLDCLKIEILDAEAFMQSFDIIKTYESQQLKVKEKLASANAEYAEIQAGDGKFSFSGLFKKQTKEEKIKAIQAKISDIKKEQQLIDFICSSLNKLMGYQEIDLHKQQKVKKYYAIIKAMAQFEMDLSKQKITLWETISQNKNIAQ